MKILPVALADLNLGIKKLNVLLNERKQPEHRLQLLSTQRLVKDSRCYDSRINIDQKLALRDTLITPLILERKHHRAQT